MRLENYLNQLIQLSPLVTNLFAVRDFLTNGKTDLANNLDESRFSRDQVLQSNSNNHSIASERAAVDKFVEEQKSNVLYKSNPNPLSLNETHDNEDDSMDLMNSQIYDNYKTNSFKNAFDQFTGPNIGESMENPFEAYNKIAGLQNQEESQGGGTYDNMKGGEDDLFKFN